MQALRSVMDPWEAEPALEAVLKELDLLGVAREDAWLLLACWVAGRPGSEGEPDVLAALTPQVQQVAPSLSERATQIFERHLGQVSSDTWQTLRTSRLTRALNATSTPLKKRLGRMGS